MAFRCMIRIRNAYIPNKQTQNVRLLTTNIISPRSSDEELKESYVIQKINDLNQWYIKLTGLDEVKYAQERVIQTQERLEKAQGERREIGKLLVDIRKKSYDIQEQLEKTKRWEDMQKYLDLRKEESEIIRSEKELTVKFDTLDKSERELFSALCNLVRDSQEKEKSQAQHTKYWGIILSIIGTMVGAIGSSIISSNRNKQMLKGISESFDLKLTNMQRLFTSNDQFSNVIIENLEEHQKTQTDAFNNLANLCVKIQDNNNRYFGAIMENKRNIESLLDRIKVGYAFTPEQIIKGNEALDVNEFFGAQRQLLEEHHKNLSSILFSSLVLPAALLLGCILCIGGAAVK